MIDEKDRKRLPRLFLYAAHRSCRTRRHERRGGDCFPARMERCAGALPPCSDVQSADRRRQGADHAEGHGRLRLEMERLSDLALHDGLTGLLNRTAPKRN